MFRQLVAFVMAIDCQQTKEENYDSMAKIK
jgi:hypothetical protein